MKLSDEWLGSMIESAEELRRQMAPPVPRCPKHLVRSHALLLRRALLRAENGENSERALLAREARAFLFSKGPRPSASDLGEGHRDAIYRALRDYHLVVDGSTLARTQCQQIWRMFT